MIKKSFEKLFEQLDLFASISGLQLNVEKTNNVWLGNKIGSETKWLTHLNMTWNPSKFKILGLWFTYNLEDMVKINTFDKYLEAKTLFNCWAKRSNTPIGRVVVLKSLILSKLIYLWIMLPNPPDDLIESLQKKCFHFIWSGKKDKIKRSVSVNHTKNGGINIPNIRKYIHALKLTWIKRIFNDTPGKWKSILKKKQPEIMNYDKYGTNIFAENQDNPFWNDVSKAYRELSKTYKPENSEELLAEPLFKNENFKIGKKTFIFPDWIMKGVLTVGMLVRQDGTFKSINQTMTEYEFNPKPLDYHGCISSIKEFMKKKSITLDSNNALAKSKVVTLLTSGLKGVKPLYNALLGEREIPIAFNKWETILGVEIDWEKVFLQINSVTEAKLKWFQIKICHRILVTNSILTYMHIVDSNKCNFCLTEKDTIQHYLWECVHVQVFWNDFVQFLKEKCIHCDRLNLNPTLVLLGNDKKTKTDACFNDILLNAKFFIYKCRLNNVKPNMHVFVNIDIKLMYKIDKYVYYRNMQMEKFHKKWMLYSGIIN